ncbi:hypothetical protein RD792_013488 [Penstemon davidsonii]|uniref:AB hydrolase-1 domain-containing protein n=1 Tax=Penstemon davidsonii TaxID=160366 RepID=A0ABR0CUL0_9LAMI|nr:hypothetical protein RD792_013488 [Penstemon davidsonii]
MAGTLQTLTLSFSVAGTPPLRRRYPFPRASYSFSGAKSNTAPLIWKLRSVSRTSVIAASSQFGQVHCAPILTVTSDITAYENKCWLTILVYREMAMEKEDFQKFLVRVGPNHWRRLTLRSDDIGAAAEAWPVGLFGLVSILIFTPFFAKFILLLKLQPQEFVTGLAIFSCMPTTLSSGVALTRLAGGNSALALAMTVISNLLGILMIPFSVSKFVAAGVGVSVPTEELLRSLVLTLLVPLILGKVKLFWHELLCEGLSFSRSLADFADGNRKLLAVISATLLSLVPWIQVSRSRSLLLMVKPAIFLVAVLMGALLHAILLGFNALAIQSLSAVSGGSKSTFAKKENASALLLVASQKTLPVMVAVVEQLGGALGVSGLLVLPCVAAHLNQAFCPPQPKICGSPGGPAIEAPRIKLRDGRYLAYKEHGVPKATANYKIILVHGFGESRHEARLITSELVEKLGIHFVSFDRPGYGQSDPDPKRTIKSTALDIEELGEQLELGPKFHIIGFSMGGQVVWGCLKYISHRLAGAALIAPVINYWWSGFPENLAKEAYNQQYLQDQWALRVAHYAPWLIYWWNTQKWFPGGSVQAGRANFTALDLQVLSHPTMRPHNREYATQQGVHESLHRDIMVGFGQWEFDPMNIENPFVESELGSVHLWHGVEDGLVPVMLQRYIAEKLPWIHYHELPNAGHLFAHVDTSAKDAILKTLLTGDNK